jgi:predicted transposase/invertase (TIGR01784 family)
MLQEKYVNPFTDFGFKKLFGEEPNKDLLIHFLNQVLPAQHHIQDLSYTKTEQLGATPVDRKAIFDLYCTSPSGERFIVEVQKAKQNYFKDRSVYYSTFPVQEQAQQGDWDFQLSPVYMVGILDFVFADERDDKTVLHTVQLKDQEGQVFYEKLTFIYLAMPNFDKKVEELETLQDKWLYVFKHLPSLQDRPAQLQERIFDRLFQAAEIAKLTKEERAAYVQSMKYYRDLKNVTDTARGEGWKEGREEGIKEIVLNAHRLGRSVEDIAAFTGLSAERVREMVERGS